MMASSGSISKFYSTAPRRLLFQQLITIGFLHVLLFFGSSNSLGFHLAPLSTKCLSEIVQNDEIVVGSYNVTVREEFHRKFGGSLPARETHPLPAVDITVKDSNGQLLAKRRQVTGAGSFVFTTDEDDTATICFDSTVSSNLRKTPTTDDLKKLLEDRGHGVFNLEINFKLEKKPVDESDEAEESLLKALDLYGGKRELQLRKILLEVDSVAKRFAEMLVKFEEFHASHEFTEASFTSFCLISLGGLVAVAVWQIIFLAKYFSNRCLL